jgi:hypothetical protein
MKLLFSILLFFTAINFSNAQTSILNADGEQIAYLKNNFLLNKNHKPLYNYKGLIVFKGSSNNKHDIVLTIDALKTKTTIYNKVETYPKWIVKDNTVFWRKNREDVQVINIKKEDGFTSFYNVRTDSLIAYVNSDTITEKEQSLILFHIWEVLDLATVFEKQVALAFSDNSNLPDGILGAMKPVFGDEFNVWFWDGQYLFPAYDRDQRYVWAFDGKTLKPIQNSRIENEWSWDGEEIKPYWGGHPSNNWRWDNGILRQVFENNYKNEYEIVDNIVRKRFGSFGDNEWEIEGEMPLPVLTLILLGIVYR